MRIGVSKSIPALSIDSQLSWTVMLNIIKRKCYFDLCVKSIEDERTFVLLRAIEWIFGVCSREHYGPKAIIVSEFTLKRDTSWPFVYL